MLGIPGLNLLAQAHYIDHVPFRADGYMLYGSNVLVSTLNLLAPDKAEEIYTHPSIPVAQIRDPDVLDRFKFYTKRHFIQFDGLTGQCSGMSDFFSHLFFQTKSAFRDEEQHLVAVAKQFHDGVGKEAALWQVAQYHRQDYLPPLLGLQIKESQTIFQPTVEKVAKVFKKLKPGLYNLDPTGHSLNFYKGRTCDYALEPNIGLIALRTPKQYAMWAAGTIHKAKKLEIHRLSQDLRKSSL